MGRRPSILAPWPVAAGGLWNTLDAQGRQRGKASVGLVAHVSLVLGRDAVMPSSRRRADSGKNRPKHAPSKQPSPSRSKGHSENVFDESNDNQRGRSRRRPEGQRLTYASLPSTPTIPSPAFLPSPSPDKRISSSDDSAPFSLWDYLREELLATDFDSHQELKWERVSNFLSIPWAIEKACTITQTYLAAADFNV
jgi:hypothetical protein